MRGDQNSRADELADLAFDEAESLLNDAEKEVAGKIAALLRIMRSTLNGLGSCWPRLHVYVERIPL